VCNGLLENELQTVGESTIEPPKLGQALRLTPGPALASESYWFRVTGPADPDQNNIQTTTPGPLVSALLPHPEAPITLDRLSVEGCPLPPVPGHPYQYRQVTP
jgi:hypothetical protein